jgi:ssDNA-binding Zn-finger/Zn-ribbon topoisomerase 1
MNLPNGKVIEKYCPKCGAGTKLVVRTNSKNNSQFLGCPNYPECKHTEKIPEALRMEGQPTLF